MFNFLLKFSSMQNLQQLSATRIKIIRHEFEIKVRLIPKNPIISGRVLDAENAERSVEKGVVSLRYDYKTWSKRHESTEEGVKVYNVPNSAFEVKDRVQTRNISQAEGNGYFKFTNLIPSYEYKKNRTRTIMETISLNLTVMPITSFMSKRKGIPWPYTKKRER